MSQWVARNYQLERPGGLRLSVSLGDKEGGFPSPTWCWFVYEHDRFWWKMLAQGTDETLEGAQTAASEWADRYKAGDKQES